MQQRALQKGDAGVRRRRLPTVDIGSIYWEYL